MNGRVLRWTSALASMGVAAATPLPAQTAPTCRVVCDATVSLWVGANRSHVWDAPTVRSLKTGATHALPSNTNLELILVTSARTALPRTSLFASVQWLPNASEQSNPFTLYTASELGTHVRANAPTATLGAAVALLSPQETAHWASLSVTLADLYSQAARPDDRSSYTHKLDTDLIAEVFPFAAMPKGTWLGGVAGFALLDGVWTGLPRTGDEVPAGERVFTSDARAYTLVAGLSLPIVTAGH